MKNVRQKDSNNNNLKNSNRIFNKDKENHNENKIVKDDRILTNSISTKKVSQKEKLIHSSFRIEEKVIRLLQKEADKQDIFSE